EHLPVRKASKAKAPAPADEYEKLYEPANPDFSLERALEIEKKSWSTTEILTSSFNDLSPNDNEPVTDGSVQSEPPVKVPENPDKAAVGLSDLTRYDEPTGNTADNPFTELFAALDSDCLDALKLLSDGESQALTRIAARRGTLADALADRINETAFDIIGDALIEPSGSGYRIIPDHAEELRKER
ncbi:MAG: tellurite resistance TerB C-terminal domain-containing protein, partial [Candidatus Flemingiibacterium sp.]